MTCVADVLDVPLENVNVPVDRQPCQFAGILALTILEDIVKGCII